MARNQFKRDLPQNFDQWVGAAYLRLLGRSQAETAVAIGVSERTIRRWETRVEWPQAIKEAESRWTKNLDQKMMRVMEGTVARLPEDLQVGSREAYSFLKWYAERRYPEFAPPARRLQAEVLEKRQYLVGAIPAGLIRQARAPETESGF